MMLHASTWQTLAHPTRRAQPGSPQAGCPVHGPGKTGASKGRFADLRARAGGQGGREGARAMAAGAVGPGSGQRNAGVRREHVALLFAPPRRAAS